MTYRDFIKSLPCSVCEDDTNVEQHHLIDLEGVEKGLSLKLPEVLSIPLCAMHHRSLHHMGLETWEHMHSSQGAHLTKTLVKAKIAGWEMKDGS